jgi:hypothetical protein
MNSGIGTIGAAALSLEIMTPEIIPFVRESEAESVPCREPIETVDLINHELVAAHGFQNHIRQLQPRNQGIARWLALAVLTGALAALAFVSFLAR